MRMCCVCVVCVCTCILFEYDRWEELAGDDRGHDAEGERERGRGRVEHFAHSTHRSNESTQHHCMHMHMHMHMHIELHSAHPLHSFLSLCCMYNSKQHRKLQSLSKLPIIRMLRAIVTCSRWFWPDVYGLNTRWCLHTRLLFDSRSHTCLFPAHSLFTPNVSSTVMHVHVCLVQSSHDSSFSHHCTRRFVGHRTMQRRSHRDVGNRCGGEDTGDRAGKHTKHTRHTHTRHTRHTHTLSTHTKHTH